MHVLEYSVPIPVTKHIVLKLAMHLVTVFFISWFKVRDNGNSIISRLTVQDEVIPHYQLFCLLNCNNLFTLYQIVIQEIPTANQSMWHQEMRSVPCRYTCITI